MVMERAKLLLEEGKEEEKNSGGGAIWTRMINRLNRSKGKGEQRRRIYLEM